MVTNSAPNAAIDLRPSRRASPEGALCPRSDRSCNHPATELVHGWCMKTRQRTNATRPGTTAGAVVAASAVSAVLAIVPDAVDSLNWLIGFCRYLSLAYGGWG